MTPTLKLLHDRCVEEGDCMLWCQGCTNGGHPIMSLSKASRSRSVRPIAWELIKGFPVPAGLFVFATCGSKRCIAADHLRVGTRSQYMRNASKHGAYINPTRNAARAQTARAKSHLTWDDVLAIRSQRNEHGRLLREIAADFRISMDVASKIARGLMWARGHGAANNSVFNRTA